MKLGAEFKVGFFILCSVALLVFLTLQTGKIKVIQKGYGITVLFKQIDGINKNAPVRLNGLEVGRIQSINILEEGNQTWMALQLLINNDVKVRQGSKALVKNLGFMGDKYIGIISGDGADYMQPGDQFYGVEPTNFDQLLSKGDGIADDVKAITAQIEERLSSNQEHIDGIFEKLDNSLANIEGLTDGVRERITLNSANIDGIFEKMHSSLTYIDAIAGRIDERIGANETHIDDMVKHLKSSTANLDEFTHDLKENPWKLLYRPKDKR